MSPRFHMNPMAEFMGILWYTLCDSSLYLGCLHQKEMQRHKLLWEPWTSMDIPHGANKITETDLQSLVLSTKWGKCWYLLDVVATFLLWFHVSKVYTRETGNGWIFMSWKHVYYTQNFNGHQKLTQTQRLGLTWFNLAFVKLVNFDEITTFSRWTRKVREKWVKKRWKAG